MFEGEDGVDAGGVQREFFQLLLAALFDASYGMFRRPSSSLQGKWWFSHTAFDSDAEFELVGKIFGLALYNGTHVTVPLASALWKRLLGAEVGLGDLRDLDPDLERGLRALLDFDGDVAEVFCRTMSVEFDF